MTLRIAVIGAGNMGTEVCQLAEHSPDYEIKAVVSRSPSRAEKRGIPNELLYGIHRTEEWIDQCDVAILCGGSKSDLPIQGPYFASRISTVDAFDTHGHVGDHIDPDTELPRTGYYRQMDLAAKATGHTTLVCQGWDPGLFSVMRGLFRSILGREFRAYAFYGLGEKGGLSMGHSDAIRQIPGVADARSFTHARPGAIEAIRSGKVIELQPGQMHWRACFVACEPGANEKAIYKAIVEMPEYFAPYETKVEFMKLPALRAQFQDAPHDGLVIGTDGTSLMEFRLQLASNPQFTAKVLLAYARAAHLMNQHGQHGAFSSLAVSPQDLLFPDDNPLSFV